MTETQTTKTPAKEPSIGALAAGVFTLLAVWITLAQTGLIGLLIGWIPGSIIACIVVKAFDVAWKPLLALGVGGLLVLATLA